MSLAQVQRIESTVLKGWASGSGEFLAEWYVDLGADLVLRREDSPLGRWGPCAVHRTGALSVPN